MASYSVSGWENDLFLSQDLRNTRLSNFWMTINRIVYRKYKYSQREKCDSVGIYSTYYSFVPAISVDMDKSLKLN